MPWPKSAAACRRTSRNSTTVDASSSHYTAGPAMGRVWLYKYFAILIFVELWETDDVLVFGGVTIKGGTFVN